MASGCLMSPTVAGEVATSRSFLLCLRPDQQLPRLKPVMGGDQARCGTRRLEPESLFEDHFFIIQNFLGLPADLALFKPAEIRGSFIICCHKRSTPACGPASSDRGDFQWNVPTLIACSHVYGF